MKRLTHTFFIVSFFTLIVFKTTEAQYWKPLGGGVTGFGNIGSLQVDTFHDILYVGGSFDSIGNIGAHDLTIWDGQQYRKLSHEPVGLTDLTMKHDSLIYLSGGFNGSKIGMYLDTMFLGLLPSLPGSTFCIEVIHDTLFAGGAFLYGLMYLDGNEWKVFQGGVGGAFSSVDDIGEYNGEMIVGGHFSEAGSVDVNNIAAWNGTEWHGLGDGITDAIFPEVYAVQEYNGELYVGGDFAEAGGLPAADIAKWNGSIWEAAEVNGCGTIYDMFSDNDKLYISGTMLRNIESCMGDRVAVFDGSTWGDLNFSKENSAFAITVFDDAIIAAGTVTEGIDNDTINCIAHFLGYPTTTETTEQNSSPVFPNPASTTITLSLPSNQNAMLSIFNLLGEKVKEEKVTASQVTLDVSSLPQGLYLVRMENGVVGKFVKE